MYAIRCIVRFYRAVIVCNSRKVTKTDTIDPPFDRKVVQINKNNTDIA
jgi:hypothetical protein